MPGKHFRKSHLSNQTSNCMTPTTYHQARDQYIGQQSTTKTSTSPPDPHPSLPLLPIPKQTKPPQPHPITITRNSDKEPENPHSHHNLRTPPIQTSIPYHGILNTQICLHACRPMKQGLHSPDMSDFDVRRRSHRSWSTARSCIGYPDS